MSKAFTIDDYHVYPGLEIRRFKNGSDYYVPLSSINTGKEEQLIQLKRNDYFKKSWRVSGVSHIDLILEADIRTQKVASSDKKYKILTSPINDERILLLIKHMMFKIENNNVKREKNRQRLTTESNLRDYNLIELFPGENLIVWDKDCPKIQFSYEEIISTE